VVLESVILWPTDKQWRDVYAAENGERHLYIYKKNANQQVKLNLVKTRK